LGYNEKESAPREAMEEEGKKKKKRRRNVVTEKQALNPIT
jgi:hypothetical protein